jgi:transcriptional regulator
MTAMYRPAVNAVDESTGWTLLAEAGAGHLITSGTDSLDASYLPFLVDAGRRTVVAHVARANQQWRLAEGTPALLIASGADAYVSPSHYPTKQLTGAVVPTWNYTVVHAHGVLRVHDDPEWLRDLVARLTDLHERERHDPWAITDAPDDFIDRNLRGIVGLELMVDRVEAKRKLSQNRTAEDVAGVIEGLSQGTARERQVAADMDAVHGS